MKKEIKRREFLQLSAAGGAIYLGGTGMSAFAANPKRKFVSPGCRGTKIKVARIYIMVKWSNGLHRQSILLRRYYKRTGLLLQIQRYKNGK